MGRKRGVHVVGVEKFSRGPMRDRWEGKRLFIVTFTKSRCKYAKTRQGLVRAKDEIDALMRAKGREIKKTELDFLLEDLNEEVGRRARRP